jgi:DNA-binding SARP family transcriptional activator
LVYDGVGYSLSPLVSIDWGRFQGLCVLAAKAAPGEAAALLWQALQLVEGPPFAATEGSEFYRWVAAEHLDLTLVATLVDTAETLAASALETGDLDTAMWAVEKGLSLDPAREQLYQCWMHILGRSGRPDRVTEIYRRLCSMLQTRIDPSLAPTAESQSIWRSYRAPDASSV